ncbi:radical SAM protein [Modestobacter sp. I12A-02628]|uniref:Heme chaperone HemW n=1 Tax=Goekera deserti TaxID=2497753 RepID=A0A7K3WDE5_9ACTN|nr:coproporphyrinogen-III oxidase family protein [Goekera deserti]MPQ96910.1 radical SAM protein [Goekera deserti]NDI46777.1 radical SAM protein [Goekera deserti]NEL54346.1 coproporphyrinogen III oxidase family protein [Goekera deserti]
MPLEQLVQAIDDVSSGAPRPLALYVHIPFCASKCHFCDWVSEVPVGRLRSSRQERSPYVAALRREIAFWGPVLTGMGYQPTVVYWGGGTPTRLDVEELLSVAEALHTSFDLSGVGQWSVETTPNDLTAEKVSALRSFGVDRVSIGAQSFDPAQLRRSGRAHSGEQIGTAVELLRSGGIDNVNLDVITGFPGEELAVLDRTFDRVLELEPPHLSVYSYRATPGTVMAMQTERATLASATAMHMVEAYELAMRRLSSAGYQEYCHSYWVKEPGFEDLDGRYKYELTGDKIGFGSGAESTIGHHLLRNESHRYADYVSDPLPFSFDHHFSLEDPQHLIAPVGGALMTRGGLSYERFGRLTGLDFAELRSTPYVRRWMDMLADFGARFIEEPDGLRLDPTTIHSAYIRHVSSTTGTGLQVLRA